MIVPKQQDSYCWTVLDDNTLVISKEQEWFGDGCNICVVCKSGWVETEDMR